MKLKLSLTPTTTPTFIKKLTKIWSIIMIRIRIWPPNQTPVLFSPKQNHTIGKLLINQTIKRRTNPFKISTQRTWLLEIEKRRHKKSWIPREQQLCKHCNLNQIEDEKQFLLVCPKYITTRKQLFLQFEVLNCSFFFSGWLSETMLYTRRGWDGSQTSCKICMHHTHHSKWLIYCIHLLYLTFFTVCNCNYYYY